MTTAIEWAVYLIIAGLYLAAAVRVCDTGKDWPLWWGGKR